MQISTIRVGEGLAFAESLPLCLEGILAAAGAQTRYDELNCALGSSFAVCARRGDTTPGEWASLARDTHLADAAALFGVRVRDLHPCCAADGLAAAPEYQEHFVDSYVPLIRGSLESGEAVLAWRGWAGKLGVQWGVLTGGTDGGLGLEGVVPGAEKPVPLTSAALQCYVVEAVAPRVPDSAEVLRCGVEAVARLTEHAASSSTGLATGVDAYDCWAASLDAEGSAAVSPVHAAFAGNVVGNREAGIRFLGALRNLAAGGLTREIGGLLTSCETTAGLLKQLIGTVESGAADARRQALGQLGRVQSAERETADRLGDLRRVLCRHTALSQGQGRC